MKTTANIIKPEEVKTLRKTLPLSWTKAAGLLKGRQLDPLKYQRTIRREWGDRLKRQLRVTRYGR
jgi:hypothetical protein